MENKKEAKPEILAPAGDLNCFLAALAAGADAVYLGLKQFSARMEADNFGLGELARMLDLAHANGRRVYVAINGLLKQNELTHAFRLTKRLADQAPADGLIIQDPAMLDIARQAGFAGGIALSTLANVSDPAGLAVARKMGATRVIAPRELSIDELRLMGQSCPPGLELECFVHGALCYCVSGRCYWSSYLGGKSGLRGRCVQPCRRNYAKGAKHGGERFFSCQDLELGELAKTLLGVPNLASWKIEGRKKGPHYVFHAVTAYRLLRDNPHDPQIRKMAGELLAMALGRPGVKARFLPQKNYQPMAPGRPTGSGLLAGKIVNRQDGASALKPRLDLLKGDYLRIGTEDERWHSMVPVTRMAPRGGELVLRLPRHKTPKTGTPVFLVDRREPELVAIIGQWRKKLEAIAAPRIRDVAQKIVLPKGGARQSLPDMHVRLSPQAGRKGMQCLWLTPRNVELSRPLLRSMCFWLPPVIWPDESAKFARLLTLAMDRGVRRFVCNAPWQRGLFPGRLPEDMVLTAGPFCNLANSLALAAMASLDFKAAIVSPELAGKDFLELPARSPLPLGMVQAGWWPVGISRFGLAGIDVNEPFSSPMGEIFWARNYGGNIWIYPAWPLNLAEKKGELSRAGYSFFVFLEEKVPAGLPAKNRPGLFNWEGQLL